MIKDNQETSIQDKKHLKNEIVGRKQNITRETGK